MFYFFELSNLMLKFYFIFFALFLYSVSFVFSKAQILLCVYIFKFRSYILHLENECTDQLLHIDLEKCWDCFRKKSEIDSCHSWVLTRLLYF